MNAGHEGVSKVSVSAYRVFTDYPESDGTLAWDSTTLILAVVEAQGQTGMGYTYADASLVNFISQNLAPVLIGEDPFNTSRMWLSMMKAIRNNGTSGTACMAVAALDVALWDLKAKLLNKPLGILLGMVHERAAVYGSGGFTSYPDTRLQEQLGEWVAAGFTKVKMKIGRNPDEDDRRIKAATEITRNVAELMVDANGAYDPRTALSKTAFFEEMGITWFEEPVSADDLTGLKFVREHVRGNIRVAAGEYGDQLSYFKKMLESRAVDVLQADATRCCGITGFLKAGTLAEAANVPFSFHCAPSLHVYPALASNSFYIGEYFHDHVRIEQMFFEGAPRAVNGYLHPNLSDPGLGLLFRHPDADKYRVA